MKLKNTRVMPVVWLAFSILYLVFSLSIEERQMPGDREGWDPGSTALPVAVAGMMMVISAYLVVTDRKKASEKPHAMKSGSRRLILLTLVLACGYVLAFRLVGFVLCTVVLLMTLVYFYQQQDVRRADAPPFVLWTAAAGVGTVLLYTLGRGVIRWAQYYGRVWEIPILRYRLVTAVLAAILWTGLIWLVARMIRRFDLRWNPEGPRAAMVATITTLALFLIFQQIFRVALPGGLIQW